MIRTLHPAKNKSDYILRIKKRTTTSGSDAFSYQEKMTTNIARVGKLMNNVAFANIVSQEEYLKEKTFDLECKKVEHASNSKIVELFECSISKLTQAINSY